VISPLLANLYINRFLKHWRRKECAKRFRAGLINYADDFVILSRGHAQEALTWTRDVMARLGLRLNEAKTSVKDARREGFDFLGYSFGPRHRFGGGTRYQGAGPSRKSETRIKTRIGGLLGAGNMAPWPEVRDELNRVLTGWRAYFSHGSCDQAHGAVERYVCDRVRHFLARRHKQPGRGTVHYPWTDIYGKLGVLRLRQIVAQP
jgi:RNA-directed DNA polymerase